MVTVTDDETNNNTRNYSRNLGSNKNRIIFNYLVINNFHYTKCNLL